jgi:enoyl-CoA hydratase/carnithine racemase
VPTLRDVVRTSRHDDVVVVEIDNPPVNALSRGVPEAIARALEAASDVPAIRAIVVRGAGRLFGAGADITALEAVAWGDESAAPDWHEIFRRIEDCPTPVVMAIHGAALGGGLELAMAGHYRVAVEAAQVGQPEVTLGVIPGGEGTQRLPRIAGLAKALDMCVSGRPIPAADALAHGIVDAIVNDDLTTAAVAFARDVADRPAVRTRERRERLKDGRSNATLFASARERAASMRRHERAPLRAIDAIEAAATLPFDDGCRREREIFLECLRSEQAKALIHLFFAQRAYTKRAGTPAGGANAPGLDRNSMARLLLAEKQSLVGQGATPDEIDRALADFGMVPGQPGDDGHAGGGDAPAERHDTPRSISDREIVERSVYALVNEGARALDAGIVARASDVDVVCVNGCGFPGWRGGPLFYADRVGLGQVLERIQTFHREHGARWKPARLLAALARDGLTFRDRDRSLGE